MNIFPLGGHPNLGVFNTSINYIDIPIETWIQLIQNNFIGIDDVQFVKHRYKLDCCNLMESIIFFKKCNIVIFYKDVITRDLWNTIHIYFSTKIIIGLTKRGFKNDNIIIVHDLYDIYELDTIGRFLNKYLMHSLNNK